MLRFHSHTTKNLHKKLLLSVIMPSKFILNTINPPLLPSFSAFSTISCVKRSCNNSSNLFRTRGVVLCSSSSSSSSSSKSAKPVSDSRPVLIKSTPRSFSALPSIRPSVALEGSTLLPWRLEKLMIKLTELRIEGYEPKPGQCSSLMCPMCEGGDSREKSLSLNISSDGNTAVWVCHRGKCGWDGCTMAIADVEPTYGKPIKIAKPITRVLSESSLGLEPLCDELLNFLRERMITPSTLNRNYVMQKNTSGNQFAIAFTYRKDGVLVNCKYRDCNKKFWQEADTEHILYGLDDIKRAEDIIIVEGEIDKLSMEEAGFLNCVSVPNGAPAKVSNKEPPPPDKDTAYQYLWDYKEYFDKASRIILATDGDEPGQALAEELARRLGRERCWRVKWPKKNEFHCKDANEVLMYLGREKLKEAIDNAEIYPIQGLYKFRHYFSEIDAYYHRVLGDELGVSTGWKCLDEYYNVVPGELTIVTGIPNSGKSEWIDALICNLNKNYGWKFALCSMENKVREHARKLLEKHIKKPFFNVRYGETVQRMTVEDLEKGKEWLDKTFHLIRCENDSLPSVEWVIERAKVAVLRHGIRGLVIDPYNELDHQRRVHMTETEYVSQMLTKVKRFAQHHACHVWFVAHPKQLQNWGGGAPNLYDISGSAHFINKCDNGIIIHRNRDPESTIPVDSVEVRVKKVRNKVSGTIGDALLKYNRITGEYADMNS